MIIPPPTFPLRSTPRSMRNYAGAKISRNPLSSSEGVGSGLNRLSLEDVAAFRRTAQGFELLGETPDQREIRIGVGCDNGISSSLV